MHSYRHQALAHCYDVAKLSVSWKLLQETRQRMDLVDTRSFIVAFCIKELPLFGTWATAIRYWLLIASSLTGSW